MSAYSLDSLEDEALKIQETLVICSGNFRSAFKFPFNNLTLYKLHFSHPRNNYINVISTEPNAFLLNPLITQLLQN